MNYDVELNANDNSVLETQYAFTQGDYGQIQFSVRVKADGAYITNATRAYIVFTLPNGIVVTGADMPKSVATYTYAFQGNELQVAGSVLADVKLVYAGGQISSNKFSFICRYDPLHDKSFKAGPYVTVLQKIVNEGQEKIDYLQTLIDALQNDIGGTVLTRSDLINNFLTAEAGVGALDANAGKALKGLIDATNQTLANLNSDLALSPGQKTLTIAPNKYTNIYFSGDTVSRAVFEIIGATATGAVLMVIPVTLSTLTASLTAVSNVLSLGVVGLTVEAAKVSDGAYRIKLGTHTAAINGFVISDKKITSISYSDI